MKHHLKIDGASMSICNVPANIHAVTLNKFHLQAINLIKKHTIYYYDLSYKTKEQHLTNDSDFLLQEE